MDYLKTRMKLYKNITRINYETFGKLLGTPYGTVYHFLRTESPTIRTQMQENFEILLELALDNLLKLNESKKFVEPVSSLWPELFVPKLRGVTYIMSLRGKWMFTREKGTPQMLATTWVIEDEKEETPRSANLSSLPDIGIPFYPKDEKYSIIKQTSEGWMKINKIAPDNSEMLKLNGKWHLPGNCEISALDNFLYGQAVANRANNNRTDPNNPYRP